MSHWQARTALILGESALSRLADARVAVLGLGGVGAAQRRPSAGLASATCSLWTTTQWMKPT